MGDRQGQGIGCVGGRGRLGEVEHLGHHHAHLGFVGPTGTGHGALDLAGRVEGHVNAMARAEHHGDAGDLPDPRHGAEIVLGEDTFDGDRLRLVVVEPLPQALFNGQQPIGVLGVRIGADDAHGHELGTRAGGSVDNSDTATRQARVNAHYAHSSAPIPMIHTRQ
ncbi:hypothetical protein MAJHIDBO_02104 [Propionibacterium freudenreichii subsp. shermanii]|nr:hypothetical protein MAJHIDBO_02104 [Propionibacterium freudenreichii subsp. shermanii]SPS09886.1 hypothetical protein MAJHIDBO_02104 [Propionibacterium freudenreichii subsp. shermanii]